MRDRVTWPDLGGGQNDSLSPSALPPNQFQRFINLTVARAGGGRDGVEAVSRPGATPLTNIQSVDRLFGACSMALDSGDYLQFAFADAKVLRAYPGAYVLHPTNGFTLSAVEADWPWRSLISDQGGVAIGLCSSRGASITEILSYKGDLTGRRLLRFTRSEVQIAGMRAPRDAPTVTDGMAGTLPNGTWTVAVRFKGDGNNRSELGPTTTVTIASGPTGSRTYSGIPISQDPQCRGREVFLSTIDGTALFRAFTIEDNTTTTYTESLEDEDLGDEVEPTGTFGMPPVNPIDQCFWRGRHWISDGKKLYPSAIFAYEGFNPTEAVSVGIAPNEDSAMMACCAWDRRDRLIFGKTTSVHYLTPGAGSQGVTQWKVWDLDLTEGIAATFSLDACEGNAFWYTGSHVKMTRGDEVVVISDDIQATLERVTATSREKTVAACDPRLRVYVISFPTNGSTTPNETVAYDWDRRIWYRFGWYYNGSVFMNPLFLNRVVSNVSVGGGASVFPGQLRLVGSFDGERRLNDVLTPGAARDDYTDLHRAIVTSGVKAANGTAGRVYAEAVYLRLRNRTGGTLANTTVTLQLRNDYTIAACPARTVPLPDLVDQLRMRELQAYALTNRTAAGSWVALSIILDGHEDVALSAIAIDRVSLPGFMGRAL